MSYFEKNYFGNTINEWLIALIISIFIYVVLKIIQKILLNRITLIAKKTENKIDDAIVEIIKQTRIFFLLIISLYAGSQWLKLPASFIPIWNKIIIVAVLLQCALWANGVLSFIMSYAVKSRITSDAEGATTMSAMKFVGKIIVWSFILILILDNLGVNISALIAGLGIGGIAAALALQNILSDLFASISIILDKPFVYGDFVVVDEMMGTVEHIGLKTTRVRSLSGEEIIFSNADLLKSRVRNFKRMYERRVLFTIGVVYQTPLEKLERISIIIKEIILSQEKARFDRVHFKEYGESALIFEAVYYVKAPEYNVFMDVQQKINFEIYRRFSEEEIVFAYPTRTILVEKSLDKEGK